MDDPDSVEGHSGTPSAMSSTLVMRSTTSIKQCARLRRGQQMRDDDRPLSRTPFACVTMLAPPCTSTTSCTIPDLLKP
ncbi:hypothetical protein BD410DRAFT_787903 [Rickenella mellea]|uniref:Uncharacterized protein n=1 Tax=Rickenella mellea TaxID=50990 RepID=A0A4Y7Q676_9AGAM|nr:hypothetical protein BD410DRAFT_787903 [Rickenella mellea]